MSTKSILRRLVHKVQREPGASPELHGAVLPFQAIPGPLALPLIGSVWRYLLPGKNRYDPERLHHASSMKYAEFGPLVRETLPGGTGLVSVFDPEDVKSFLQQTASHPDRRSHLALNKYRLDRPHMYSSGGLLPSNGEAWHQLRKGSQVVFGKPEAVLGHLPDVEEVMRDFVAHLRRIRRADNSIDDLLDSIKMMNLEVMLVVLLDERFGCLSPHPSAQSQALMRAGGLSTQAIFSTDNGPLQLYRFFNTPLYRQLCDSQDLIYRVAKDHYDRKKRALALDPGGARPLVLGEGQTPILEYLVRSPALGEREVIGLLCDSLMAGVDTTSFTLAFILYHLANNSRAQQQLAQEADQLLATSGGKVTARVLSQAHYTMAVVRESLRLNPISVGIGRVNTHRPIVLRGHHIPAGTLLVSMNQHIGRNPAYFSDPDQFRPERFLTGPRPHSHALLPFGQGSRSCIAQRIARQTLYTALLHLAHNFNMTWHGGVLDCKVRLINEPDGPLCVRLADRAEPA